MNRHAHVQRLAGGVAVCALLLIGGCGSLLSKPTPQPALYGLNATASEPAAASTSPPAIASATRAAKPTLLIGLPQAEAGFDTARIIYVRAGDRREYFAQSQWIDTPARMLSPLLVATLGASGKYRAVVAEPSTAASDVRLDTRIVRLQQDFTSTPSRVRFTLRAYLIAHDTHEVTAWREFDVSEVAGSEDPAGGVLAAQKAVRTVLTQLTAFCEQTSSN